MTFPEPQVSFSSNFAYSSMSWNIIPLHFFSSNIMYFVQIKPIKVQVFETFECLGKNSSNSSSQFWNDKSIPLQILYHSSLPWLHCKYYAHKFPTLDKRIPSKSRFWDFQRLWWKFHFPNNKSVFLQMLHQSSLSWKIIPLYFFRSVFC